MIEQTGTQDLFLGLVVGTAAGICAGIIVAKTMISEVHTINETSVIAAYAKGKHSALSTQPPSLELEITCANMWAGRVQAAEVLK